jgi:hypothetical protein
MGEDEAGAQAIRAEQQRRNSPGLRNLDLQFLRIVGIHRATVTPGKCSGLWICFSFDWNQGFFSRLVTESDYS